MERMLDTFITVGLTISIMIAIAIGVCFYANPHLANAVMCNIGTDNAVERSICHFQNDRING